MRYGRSRRYCGCRRRSGGGVSNLATDPCSVDITVLVAAGKTIRLSRVRLIRILAASFTSVRRGAPVGARLAITLHRLARIRNFIAVESRATSMNQLVMSAATAIIAQRAPRTPKHLLVFSIIVDLDRIPSGLFVVGRTPVDSKRRGIVNVVIFVASSGEEVAVSLEETTVQNCSTSN